MSYVIEYSKNSLWNAIIQTVYVLLFPLYWLSAKSTMFITWPVHLGGLSAPGSRTVMPRVTTSVNEDYMVKHEPE